MKQLGCSACKEHRAVYACLVFCVLRALKERVASSFAGCSLGCSTRVDRLCCTDYHDRHTRRTLDMYRLSLPLLSVKLTTYVEKGFAASNVDTPSTHPVGKLTLPATTLVAEEESVTPSDCSLRQQRVQPLPLVTQSPPLMLMMGLVMQLLYWPTQRN